ncbi:high mobility group protein [Cystoisospora suis]|uniref:High mobility group protein n=1 Tax=Cystoisospora suis TaxID=483139 RepID=A0A2C6KJC4_9APIC|nr:high mobility group protein [Cystoisospora suis]
MTIVAALADKSPRSTLAPVRRRREADQFSSNGVPSPSRSALSLHGRFGVSVEPALRDFVSGVHSWPRQHRRPHSSASCARLGTKALDPWCFLFSGLALRGPQGFKSMVEAIQYLQKQQDRILWCFMASLACFVLSSFMIIYVFGRRQRLAIRVETALLFVTLAIAFMSGRAILLFQHRG